MHEWPPSRIAHTCCVHSLAHSARRHRCCCKAPRPSQAAGAERHGKRRDPTLHDIPCELAPRGTGIEIDRRGGLGWLRKQDGACDGECSGGPDEAHAPCARLTLNMPRPLCARARSCMRARVCACVHLCVLCLCVVCVCACVSVCVCVCVCVNSMCVCVCVYVCVLCASMCVSMCVCACGLRVV